MEDCGDWHRGAPGSLTGAGGKGTWRDTKIQSIEEVEGGYTDP